MRGTVEKSAICHQNEYPVYVSVVYINDLECGIKSQIKFFADDTSLYSVVKDPIISAAELQHDLDIISEWANQWKMSFNPDPTKPAEEILFSQKASKIDHPPLFFNGIELKRVSLPCMGRGQK